MPYTLLKFLGWLIAALLIGVLIGWWLWGRRSSATAVAGAVPAAPSDSALFDALIAERDQLAADLDACRAAAATPGATVLGFSAAPSVADEPPPTPDVAAGAAVLGRKIALDDLTVVEGIGPKIGELCNSIGVHTWWALANTDVDVLRAMLNDAGPRFQMHDPVSWPDQARLLSHGQWREFAELTDRLQAGRTTE